jgi:hypothetical protein
VKDADRILGRLEEFKEHTTRRLDTIDLKIDRLNEWKWRIAGGTAVISAIVTLILNYWRH